MGPVHACCPCDVVFVGMRAGPYAYENGIGPFGGIIVGFGAGGLHSGGTPSPSRSSPFCVFSLGCYSRFRRHAPGMMRFLPFAHRHSLGMVAGGVRRSRCHHGRRRGLGAPIDAGRSRTKTGCCTQPYSAAECGDDYRQVTLRVYRRSVGIRPDIRSSNMTATSQPSLTLRLRRSISSAGCNPSGGWHLRWPLFGNNGPPFCTPVFLFLRREFGTSCVGQSIAGTSPKCFSAHANTSPLIGLIWPKAGCTSIA